MVNDCLHHLDGLSNDRGVKLVKGATFHHDIAKICGKVHNVIEDLLKDGVTMPVKTMYVTTIAGVPLILVGAVDDKNKLVERLAKKR